ncbi:hypothetical protein [Leptolyngbya sp. FACHB-541]|nr:hypothetical protein [Leptolyngbya sp. FACHB-541]
MPGACIAPLLTTKLAIAYRLRHQGDFATDTYKYEKRDGSFTSIPFLRF